MKVRHYIYHCSKTKQTLNIFQLQKEIKNKYEEKKLLSRINCQNHIFDKKWSIWQSLFLNI